MMGNIGPNAINYALYRQLPYKPEDFVPITLVVSVPNVLVVNPKVPAHNVAELVALAKASRAGCRSAPRAPASRCTCRASCSRSAPASTSSTCPTRAPPRPWPTVAGQVTMMVDNLPSSLPQIRAGKLRALAVTSAARLPELAEVPTMKEAGFDDFRSPPVRPGGASRHAPGGDRAAVQGRRRAGRPRGEGAPGRPGGQAGGDTPNTSAASSTRAAALGARGQDTGIPLQ